MRSILSIHQPSYFPWLGLLHKISKSDKFIIMDEVQLADRGYQHRNVFLTKGGDEKKLTVNISKKGLREKTISDLTISIPQWRVDHRNFLVNNYDKHPYFDEIMSYLNPFYNKEYEYLIDVLIDSMAISFDMLGVNTSFVKMSSLDFDREKYKSDLILDLAERSGCQVYLSGVGAKDYMSLDDFKAAGIEVIFQDFSHPNYTQLYSEEFIPGLSCLDMLFNEGIDKSRSILKSIK